MNKNEWRKQRQQGEDGVLPSGLDVKLRKLSVVDLVTQGVIPQTLATKLNGMARSDEMKFDIALLQEMTPILNAVAKACILEPTDLDVENELPYEDKLAIFNWANEGVSQMQSFRPIKKADVGATSDGENLQPTTEFVVGVGS